MKNIFDNQLLTPLAELEKRIKYFQSQLRKEKLDGALIIQSSDLVYFCGTHQNAHLYIPAEGTPIVMVRKDLDRMKTDSKLNVPMVPIKKMSELVSFIKEFNLPVPRRLGLEMDVIPAAYFIRYQNIFANSKFFDCTPIIRRQRQVKSAYELLKLKETAKMMDRIFDIFSATVRPGIREFELTAEIEAAARREGHQGMIRIRGFNIDFSFGQLLSGPNSAMTSYFDGSINGVGLYPEFPLGPGNKTITRNEPILFDFAGAKSGYTVDMTRTFVIGKTAEKFNKAYQITWEIQQLIIQETKPGILSKELYELSINIAKKYNLEEYFLGSPHPVNFVGHGIGLELDELPILAKGVEEPLEEGMVFALEPKFVFPGEGGVGVENTFILNKAGLEKLSSFPDDHIIEINR